VSVAAARLTVLGRSECGLCEEMQQALVQLAAQYPGFPAWSVQDVDDDPVLVRRHGLDVPVLLLDGVKVCQHHLDGAALLRLLRPRAGAAQV